MEFLTRFALIWAELLLGKMIFHKAFRLVLAAGILSAGVSASMAQEQSPGSDDGFSRHSEAKVKLGRLLFFDKILSGNRNISCASCHHPLNGTSDGLPLGIGEGGRGLGPGRTLEGVSPSKFDIKKRIPRNAPALFNLGHKDFTVMFHDGRVQASARHPSGFQTPAKEQLPRGLESALAAQAMFPPTSNDEMAGEPGSNPVADAAKAGKFAGSDGVWELLAQRVRSIREYQFLFAKAFPKKFSSASDIKFVDIANAIAAFESVAWRADDAPFDRFMSGDGDCMSKDAREGLVLFLGKGQCSNCHSGKFQTDHRFHSIAMPQIGPGKGDSAAGNHDYGRERVTSQEADRFKFRTPSLRNVALTAPYGHCGAYPDLKSVIRHHMRPATAVANFDPTTTRMPNTATLTGRDVAVMQNSAEVRNLANRSEIAAISLTDEEVEKVIAFLHCLTDPRSLNLLHEIPMRVPSGLSVYD